MAQAASGSVGHRAFFRPSRPQPSLPGAHRHSGNPFSPFSTVLQSYDGISHKRFLILDLMLERLKNYL